VCALAGAETVLYGRGNGLANWYYYFSEGKSQPEDVRLADIAKDDRKDGAGRRQSGCPEGYRQGDKS
jgi:hypothetical protein